MNSLNIIGRLTKDPEQVATRGGTEMTTFSIAVDDGKDETSFYDCKAFGSTAENVARYKHKGDQVGVSGHLKQDRWEKDGQKRSKVVIMADRVDFIGPRQESGASTDPVVARAEQVFGGKAVDAGDDDIPF